MEALRLVTSWPVDQVAAGVVTPAGVETIGDADRVFRLASLSKPIAAWAALVAVEEGIVDLDGPIERDDVPHGATLRHLLSHAAGLPFDGADPIAPVGRRRIYSNTGIERAADVVATAADMPFEAYQRLAVFEPLGMSSSELRGSPAHQIHSSTADVARFLGEVLTPRLLAPETAACATSIQYPDLAGIVPGVGTYDPCPWGLGLEIKGDKDHHWMGRANSPATVGHFGGAGTMMWVDLDARVGAVALTDRAFDEWAIEALRLWPEFSDAVLAEQRSV